MLIYKLDKPDIENISLPVTIGKIEDYQDFSKKVRKAAYPKYLYWDKIKHLPPPTGFTSEEYWAFIKVHRSGSPNRKKSVIEAEGGGFFNWELPPESEAFFHDVDMQLGGNLTQTRVHTEKERNQFISRGVMEEAIASSQLEGASTTRQVAKKMLLRKRNPKTVSEIMIRNNYQAMLRIESEYKNVELSESLLLELHEMLVRDTKKDPSEVGRFRRDSDEIIVSDSVTDVIYHIPPKLRFLKPQLRKFIDYANDDLADKTFTHPITKAIMLHFWIGYLHPFTDGNGRLARTLFYWYLLRHNYWAFSYLPISQLIRKSPIQYKDAYLYTEQDDLDLTYFIDYNQRKIREARRAFEQYVARVRSENSSLSKIVQHHLNERQIQALKYLGKHFQEEITYNSYATINNISRLTATKDIKKLETTGLLEKVKRGKQIYFYPTDKLTELFN